MRQEEHGWERGDGSDTSRLEMNWRWRLADKAEDKMIKNSDETLRFGSARSVAFTNYIVICI